MNIMLKDSNMSATAMETMRLLPRVLTLVPCTLTIMTRMLPKIPIKIMILSQHPITMTLDKDQSPVLLKPIVKSFLLQIDSTQFQSRLSLKKLKIFFPVL